MMPLLSKFSLNSILRKREGEGEREREREREQEIAGYKRAYLKTTKGPALNNCIPEFDENI